MPNYPAQGLDVSFPKISGQTESTRQTDRVGQVINLNLHNAHFHPYMEY